VKKLFVDTGAFIARAIVADDLHRTAVHIWNSLANAKVQLVSTEHVFDETMTLLARRVGYPYAAQWGELHLQSKAIDWMSSDRLDLSAALSLMKKYADQSISFTDCISFCIMRKHRVKEAFSFDRHFRFAGFSVRDR
jgi:uncharacterized protein